MKKALILSVLAAVIFSAAGAGAANMEFSLGEWVQKPSGSIAYYGDQLDMRSELKYGSTANLVARVRLWLPNPFPKVYLMATPLEYDETGITSRPFTFAGLPFAANVPFRSKTYLKQYDLGFFYSLPYLKKATLDRFNLDLGINARIINARVDMRQDSAAQSKNTTYVVPMALVAAQFTPVKRVSIEAEARAMPYGQEHFYDFLGRVKFRFLNYAFLSGGYRYEDLKIDHNGVRAKIRTAGPFAEAGVEF